MCTPLSLDTFDVQRACEVLNVGFLTVLKRVLSGDVPPRASQTMGSMLADLPTNRDISYIVDASIPYSRAPRVESSCI